MSTYDEKMLLPERRSLRRRVAELTRKNRQLEEELKLKRNQLDALWEDANLIRDVLAHHGIVLGGESIEARRQELRRQVKLIQAIRFGQKEGPR